VDHEHPLLERAQKYPYRNIDLAPAGCCYDASSGAWRVTATGELWADTPGRKGPRTKKADIETGEDQKGE
jgi:hypothetical protein